MKKKFVYLASPYTGQELQGVKWQIDMASKLIDAGFVVIWPLCAHFIHTVHPKHYEVWIEQDLGLIERCDIMLRKPVPSKGADIEERHAHKLGIPVYYDSNKLIEDYGK